MSREYQGTQTFNENLDNQKYSNQALGKQLVELATKSGAARSKANVSMELSTELYIVNGTVKLVRTAKNNTVDVTVIKDEKKGSSTINKTDNDSVKNVVSEAIALSNASKADPAYDISAIPVEENFSQGPLEPDQQIMYMRLEEFIDYIKSTHPKVSICEGGLQHVCCSNNHTNSNGVSINEMLGYYGFFMAFVAKDKKKSSSYNFTQFFSRDLSVPLQKQGLLSENLQDIEMCIETKRGPEKLSASVLFSPACFDTIIGSFSSHLSDTRLIDGNSIYKDKINKKVASDLFSLRCAPLSKDLAVNRFYNSDGFLQKDVCVVEEGILNTFLLSLYGSRKTGIPRSLCDNGSYVIDPGSQSVNDLLSSIPKGLYVHRLSGGRPSDNGDFSFVAKNSFFVEDGKKVCPLKETMISGNIADLLMQISGVSKERYNSGRSIMPWIKCEGLTISSC